MIIVKFKGGFGNYMFQYAFYLSLKNKYPSRLIYMDLSYYKKNLDYELDLFDAFDLTPMEVHKFSHRTLVFLYNSPLQRLFYRLFGRFPYYFRDEKNVISSIPVSNRFIYLEGYFISEDFFKPYRADIVKEFSIDKITVKSGYYSLLKSIKESNSIGIHVRLGDYLESDIHNVIRTSKYYTDALKFVKLTHQDIKVFVFSNDVSSARDFLGDSTFHYIESVDVKDNLSEFVLMTHCRHLIISNSTFSWWAAYLKKETDGLVITPSKWFSSDDYNENNIRLQKWLSLDV